MKYQPGDVSVAFYICYLVIAKYSNCVVYLRVSLVSKSISIMIVGKQ